MGTNYYLHTKSCEHCGHSDKPLHIGKSSAGWHFLLHVYPELGLNDLGDWIDRILKAGWIEDEYGEKVTPGQLYKTITQRRKRFGQEQVTSDRCKINSAVQGLNGLMALDCELMSAEGRKSYRGEGTWDCCAWDFS